MLWLVAGALGALTLTGIHHSEGDLTLEWNMLRVGALVFLVFMAVALYTLARVTKALK